MERLPVTYLNYPNDRRIIVETYYYDGIGPGNERIYPVTAEYNEETHMTRIGFSYIRPTE